jgi:hypothetical protein
VFPTYLILYGLEAQNGVLEARNGVLEAPNGVMEAWRVCRPVFADSHHLDKEEDPDPEPDPH